MNDQIRLEIVELILDALKDLRNSSEKERAFDISGDAVLFGHCGNVDSLGLVQLLIDVEERVSRRYGVAVSLTDDRAMSQEHSPFRTVRTLAEYLSALITEQRVP